MEMMSQEVDKIFAAICKAQQEMNIAPKDSNNPFFKSKYADLQTVWETIKEPLFRNGLCLIQTIQESGENATLVTMLAHSSGQWIRSVTPMKIKVTKATKDGVVYEANLTPQEFCAMVTYFRRMTSSAISGCVAGEADDDGESLMDRNSTKAPIPVKKPVGLNEHECALLDSMIFELNDDAYYKKACSALGVKSLYDMDRSQFERTMKSFENAIKIKNSKKEGYESAGVA